MCGISGVIHTQRYSKSDVGGMVDCIKYRGPDEQGVEKVGPCVLGHARLAVVDPENGSQPMSNTDDTVWVVFNGGIYNFVEIREDLKAKGYHFESNSDTEVLVHLWREKGEAMMMDLIGVFAFCIWDTRTNSGILARDHQGIKPCYIMDLPDGGMAFASEIKSLFALPGITPEIDEVGLNLMHNFNYCPPPRTCYKGVSHLEPGSYILLDGAGNRVKKKYWSWPIGEVNGDVHEDDFAGLLDDAIKMQMRFDVKGCLFLSGGVDSSIIAAHLRPQWNEDKMLAFGLDCKIDGFGEYHLSEYVAKTLNIDLRPVTYDHQIVPESIEAVLHNTDQPHGDFSFFLLRLLSSAAREAGATVAFNGDGADEAFSGFSYNEAFFAQLSGNPFSMSDYYQQICFMSDASRSRVLRPDFNKVVPNSMEAFEDLLSPWSDLQTIDQVSAHETMLLLPGNNLIKTDRMGAGQSIEGRSPFMDHRVSEMMSRMPLAQKTSQGIGKYFLKQYGMRFFEKDHMFRKKSKPTMPIGEWIKDPLRDWAHGVLSDLDQDRYNVLGVLQMFEDHVAEKANHTRELRTLLMASSWMKKIAA